MKLRLKRSRCLILFIVRGLYVTGRNLPECLCRNFTVAHWQDLSGCCAIPNGKISGANPDLSVSAVGSLDPGCRVRTLNKNSGSGVSNGPARRKCAEILASHRRPSGRLNEARCGESAGQEKEDGYARRCNWTWGYGQWSGQKPDQKRVRNDWL